TDVLLAVTNAAYAVFSPAVRLGAGMIVRKILPEGALCAVVLPHGAPAAFAEIGAPALPIFFPGGVLRQALPLCRRREFRGIIHGCLFFGSSPSTTSDKRRNSPSDQA